MKLFTGRILSSGMLGLLFPVLFFCKNPSQPQPLTEIPSAPTIINHTNSQDTLSYIMGKFEPSNHELFGAVEIKYANRTGMFLRKETLEAFIRMYNDALGSGVHLKIISATRNFNSQKTIWEVKWTGTRLVEDGQNLANTTPDPVTRALKILEYSSMPGSSRHHWGTDMDLNNLDNGYFEHGEGKKIYTWLKANAGKYGFCQPYSAGRPHGYKEERWHWTYLPLARPLTDFSKKSLKNEMISGFLGSETAAHINIVNHYILGINQECK